jgi:hypothetical protein
MLLDCDRKDRLRWWKPLLPDDVFLSCAAALVNQRGAIGPTLSRFRRAGALHSRPMARRNAKVEKLAKVPLFSECSNADLSRIASVADEVAFRPGRTLIKEGARGREFIVVLDGTVEVKRKGRKIPLKGGDFFGEMALLTDKPRNATVTTTSDVRALVITDRAFQSLLRDNPQIQRKVLAALAARIDDGP